MKNHLTMRPLMPFFFQKSSFETKCTGGRGNSTGIRKLSMLARWFEATMKPPSRGGTFSRPVTRGLHSSLTGGITAARAPM